MKRHFREQVLKDLFDSPLTLAGGSTVIVKHFIDDQGSFAAREINAVRLGSLRQYVKSMLMALNGIELAKRADLFDLNIVPRHHWTYLSRTNGIGQLELSEHELVYLKNMLRLFDPGTQKSLNAVFDVLVHSNRALLIADFVDGEDLDRYLSELVIVQSNFVDFFEKYITVYQQIDAVLLALNEKELMHLDMHPSNLIFDFGQQYLKLLDLDSLCSGPQTILPPFTPEYVCDTANWNFTVEQQNVFLLIKYYNDLMLRFRQNFEEGVNGRQLMYCYKDNWNKPFEQVRLELGNLIDQVRKSLPREVILVSI